MLENLLLSVGAMKAGTTWLYEQLKTHPQIYFTPEKEIHYFANKVGIEKQLNHRNRLLKLKAIMEKTAKANPMFISQNIDDIYWYAKYAKDKEITNTWYESLFDSNNSRKYCADFSNLYCQMDSQGWNNVKAVSKNNKIIYTLRDPIKRLWSHYKFHMKWVNLEDEAINIGFDHFKDLLSKHWFWVNAQYVRNYNLIKENVCQNDLLILYFEDVRTNPLDCLYNIQDFLEIDRHTPKLENMDKKVNETKDFEIPDEWFNYMVNCLKPEVELMMQSNLWHPDWENI